MDHLLIKNWEKYQHYKNRNPPWIKLHIKILNDKEFMALPLSSKGLLIQLWILAAEDKEGKIPFDYDEIKFRLREKTLKIEDLNFLISKGFLKICKQVLAEDNKKCSETEGETELLLPIKDIGNNCPQKEIVALWKKLIPELPQPKSWDGTRQTNLRMRWKEDNKRQSLDWWERFFKYIRKSPFLMGQTPPSNGHPQFYAKLDWVVTKQKFDKIREGDYHRGEKL